MDKIVPIKLTLIFLLISTFTFAQQSPRKNATGNVNNVAVTINYGSPSVKGRIVWGGLEKYDKIWRAGANENTTFSFNKDVKIGGTTVTAGKYGFFIIPKKDSDWIVILNKKNDAWGAFSYNKEDDILRLKVTPNFVKDNQETLEYTIEKNGIGFAWEKVRILIPIN